MSEPKKKSLQEIVAEEYKKCAASPVYFMKNYVKIQHQMKGTIKFDLFPFQENTLQDFHEFAFNIILKSRQMGISTLVAAYSLWLMIFNRDKNILIISIKQEVSKELISKVRFATDNLPIWLKIPCIEDNRLSLKFKNGSHIRAVSSSGDAGRSMAVYLLILDEAAFIENIDDIWASAWSTLSTGGNSIVLSTPNGIGQWFHRMWVDAEEKRNNFNPIKLPWHLHPERNQTWRDAQTKELGEALAGQECDTNFLASGDNVISLEIIEEYKKTIKKDPYDKRLSDRCLWYWKEPNYDNSYILSADTARGDGGDYQACHVLDVVSMEQCAEYKGQVGTTEYGNMLVNLATEYNNALLVIERENTGWAVIQQVINRKYSNLFYMTDDLKYVDPEHQYSNRYNAEEKKSTAGFTTSMKTRPVMIDYLRRYMSDKEIKIYSARTLSELETFIWKNFKAQAMHGYNDDLVMSLCIGLWIRDTALLLRQKGIELTRSSLDHFRQAKIDNVPVYHNTQKGMPNDPWNMKTGGINNEVESLKWLIG